jgi:uncharacterized membrane protein HdeD (DUF308 family)
MEGFIDDLWWMILIQGVVMLLFGLFAVVWPGLTFGALVLAFSIYIIVAGIVHLLVSIGSIAHHQAWFLKLLLGVLEIGVGIYLLKTPGVALNVFIIAIGVIFMLQGIFAIIAAFIDENSFGLKMLEIIVGALGIMAGFIVLQNPVAGGIAFAWVLGVYGIVAGTVTIAESFAVRSAAEELRDAGVTEVDVVEIS